MLKINFNLPDNIHTPIWIDDAKNDEDGRDDSIFHEVDDTNYCFKQII